VQLISLQLDPSMESVRLLLTVTDSGDQPLNSTIALKIILRRDIVAWSLSELLSYLLTGGSDGGGSGGDGTAIVTVIALAAISLIIILCIVLICVVHRRRENKSHLKSRQDGQSTLIFYVLFMFINRDVNKTI